MKKNDTFGMIMAVMVVILVIGALPALVSVMNHNNDVQVGRPSDVEAASYIIYKDGDYTCAKNGTSGRIESRSQNSSTAIQYALDRAIGTVLLKEGEYEVNLNLYDSCSLVGVGNATKLIRDDQSLPVIDSETASNITISDMVIDGTNDLATSSYSVRLRNVTDAMVTRVAFIDGGAVRTLEITDRNDIGWYLANISRIRVIDNVFFNNKLNAIGSICAHDVIISGNFIYGVPDSAIEMSGGGYPSGGICNAIITNNQITDAYVGIITTELSNEEGSKLIISNNLLNGIVYSGINCQAPTGLSGDGGVVISGNHITAALTTGSVGVTITRLPKTQILNNYIDGFGYAGGPSNYAGIRINSDCTKSVVMGNYITNHSNFAIYTISDYTSICSNQIHGNDVNKGVYVNGNFCVIDSNTIVRTIRTMELSGKYHDVTNNLMHYNKNGIYLNAQYCNFFSNVFRNTTYNYEIVEEGSSNYNVIKYNVFKSGNTLTKLGANTVVADNTGYITVASGSVTMSSGSKTKSVYPGLAGYAASYKAIIVTGTTAESASVWVAYTPGANNFVINVASNVSVDTVFYWYCYI